MATTWKSCLLAASIGMLALLPSATSHADPGFQVCSSRAFDLWVAIGWRTGSGVHSAGWYKVPGCGCQTVLNGQPEDGVFWAIYKRADDFSYVSDGTGKLLCTKPTEAFRFDNADTDLKQCPTVGDFQAFSTRPGDTSIHLRPTPRKTDKICID